MNQVVIADQWYATCVRREYGYCAIEWGATQGLASTLDSFDLQPATAATTALIVCIFETKIQSNSLKIKLLQGGPTASASNAYIAIPGAIADLYSGEYLAAKTTGATADGTVIGNY